MYTPVASIHIYVCVYVGKYNSSVFMSITFKFPLRLLEANFWALIPL